MSGLTVEAVNGISEVRDHALKNSGVAYYQASMVATATTYDLVVDGADTAKAGVGTLLAVGYSASTTSGVMGLENILTYVDGNTVQTTSGLNVSGAPFDDSIARTLETVTWVPMHLNFTTSLKVRVKSGASGSGTGYAHALVRWNV